MPNKEGGGSSYIRRRQQRTIDGKSIQIPRSSSCATSIIDSDEEEDIDKMKTVGPLTIRGVLSSQRNLFLALLAFRITNVFLIQTTFVPDEFWQSVEVAHNWAFGYGHLTWEWRSALRSPLYPFIFACLFKLLALCGLDSRLLVIKLPQIVQALFAALADLHLYKFSKRISGQYVAQWTLFSHLVNWFTLYTATRTLGNSVEWGLTIIALSYYPWPNPSVQDNNLMEVLDPEDYQNLPPDSKDSAVIPRKAQWKFVLVVAISVLLRPTVAVLWLPFCLYHLYSQRAFLLKLIPLYAFIGLFCLGLSAVIEKHFYGRWTLSQWNFLEFNVFSDASRFYGVHPWHWYVTQGWPVMLASQLPLFVIAVFTEATTSANKLLLGSIAWTIYIYSFRAHKEFRFLFPLVPLAMHFCGLIHARWHRPAPYGFKYHRVIVIGLIISQVCLAFYSGLVHQRGGIDAIMALGRKAEQMSTTNAELGRLSSSKPLFSAVFLMPCHSTPYYSHIHHNVTLRFLTCDPDLSGKFGKSYTDEADQFYAQPISWLQRQYSSPQTRPSYFILFDVLVESTRHFSQELIDLLSRWNYTHCRTFFHAHIPLGRQGSRVYAFCSHGIQL